MPRDLSFHTLMAFVFGFEGYSTYTGNFQTAESLRELARAHTQIARYEDVIFDRPILDNVHAKLLTEIPQVELAGNPTVDPLFVRAWQMDDGQLIALGNDSPYEVMVQLSVSSLPAGQYVLVDPISGEVFVNSTHPGFTREMLAHGVTIPMDSKRWRFLELVPATADLSEGLIRVDVAGRGVGVSGNVGQD